MKYFLATFTQMDGEHEHVEYATATKRSVGSATKWCEHELYDGDNPKNSLWGYSDGETAVTDYRLTEITADEYTVLSKYLFCATPKVEANLCNHENYHDTLDSQVCDDCGLEVETVEEATS